jgi:hypothetical protein
MNGQHATPAHQPASPAYRFLTGCAGGLLVFCITQAAAMMIPNDGAVLIRAFLEIGGMLIAVITPFRSILGDDVTYGGVVSKNSLTP